MFITVLNTMFKNNANTMFNNKAFKCAMIPAMAKREKKERTTPMHEQMARLYEAAEKIKGVTGQSNVGRLIHVSPQNMNRWEARGISGEGMIVAQEFIGCSPLWIRSGVGPMVIGELFIQQEVDAGGGLADALKLTTETSTELQMLSVFRLANKDEREAIGMAIESVRLRLRRDMFGDDPK